MKILHILKLSGIGGVQSQFEVFFNNLTKKDKSSNLILNTSSIDPSYASLKIHANRFLYKVLILFFSRNILVHSYNNLVSKKFYFFYYITRPRKLIFHERGNAWNQSFSKKNLAKKNANLSNLILCNSNAAKIILNRKFNIDLAKMKVIYNGVISDKMIAEAKNIKARKYSGKFVIGFVGRLEINKGVHTLIKSMQNLDNNEFELNIIGDGSSRAELEKYAVELGVKSIRFFGRVKNAWSKMKNFDVIVVPSIREPLGNVIIEAALNKVPIIASQVDGIPEIITDKQSGILIKPTLPVDKRFITGSVPLPEVVVDVFDNKLIEPKELDPEMVIQEIKYIKANKDKASEFADNLYANVINKFHIKKYTETLFKTYDEVYLMD